MSPNQFNNIFRMAAFSENPPVPYSEFILECKQIGYIESLYKFIYLFIFGLMVSYVESMDF